MNQINCTHHWLLPEPDGPTVTGKCRKCSAERIYKTSMPNPSYDDYVHSVTKDSFANRPVVEPNF